MKCTLSCKVGLSRVSPVGESCSHDNDIEVLNGGAVLQHDPGGGEVGDVVVHRDGPHQNSVGQIVADGNCSGVKSVHRNTGH